MALKKINVKKHPSLLFKKLEQGTVCCFEDQNHSAADPLHIYPHKVNKSLISSNHPGPDLWAPVKQPDDLRVLTSLGLQKQELG